MRIFLTLAGIGVGLFGLGIDFWQMVVQPTVASPTNPEPRSLPEALIWFWTYFTHLSNLGLLLVYLATLTGWRWLGWFAKPRTQAAMGGYILLVMLYYHFMLSGRYAFEGPMLWATFTLHYIAPIYYLLWWAACTPHGSLRYSEIGRMLIPGLLYVMWVLLRGAIVGEYPYDILDAGKFGYGAVAAGIGALLAAVVVFCAIMVGADRLLVVAGGRRTV